MNKILVIFLILLAPALADAQTGSIPSVDLVWEARTYTPPDYQGRCLVTPESLVRVVALTETKNLTFYWRKDGTEIKSASGASRDVFTYRAGNTIGSSNLIEMVATQTDGAVAARAAARIPVGAPKIVFYEVKDGQINYRRALKNFNLMTDQAKIVAEPFYFSTPDWLNRRLSFNWMANGQKIAAATEDPRFLTLITKADTAGETMLDLKITNSEHLFQTAAVKLSVNFGQTSFGF